MSFDQLGLSAAVLKAVKEKGYSKPSPIQAASIPLVLNKKDILASAQTGTGKTASFTLPIIDLIDKQPLDGKKRIKSLILTPTRELAAQIYDNIRVYSKYTDIKTAVVFGGVKAGKQIATLKQGVDILVATPGRLLDLHQQRALSLNHVQIFVLDEADRMLDMGFVRDLKRIQDLIPAKRQNLLFSATFSKEIKKLAESSLNNPSIVEVSPKNSTAEKVAHKIYRLNKGDKPKLLMKLITEGNWKQVLVFTRTKHGANKLSEILAKNGITSSAIHGNKAQNARTKALAGFKNGEVNVLVATDIAARGLDIPLLPHVVNYELPNIAEDYVHRIGRTGRAGAAGQAISLVSIDEVEYVTSIEKLLNQKIEKEVVKGFEPTEKLSDLPAKKPQGGRRSSSPKAGANGGRTSRSSSAKSSDKKKSFGGKKTGAKPKSSGGGKSKPKRKDIF